MVFLIFHNISSFISILMSQPGPWHGSLCREGTKGARAFAFQINRSKKNLRRLSKQFPFPCHTLSLTHVILHQEQIRLLKIFILNSMCSIYLNIYCWLHQISFARESIYSPYSQRTRRIVYPLHFIYLKSSQVQPLAIPEQYLPLFKS